MGEMQKMGGVYFLFEQKKSHVSDEKMMKLMLKRES